MTVSARIAGREVREFNYWTDCRRYAVTVDLSIYPRNLNHPTLPRMGLGDNVGIQIKEMRVLRQRRQGVDEPSCLIRKISPPLVCWEPMFSSKD